MFAYPTPASRSAIAARVAELSRRMRSRRELVTIDERQFSDLPFGLDEARAEAAQSYWPI
jgi:uncharacterized protein YjiS (DUF1127 family)